ncbi:MAG TPA: hypothetical protein VF524_15140 [Polyangia bacterium]
MTIRFALIATTVFLTAGSVRAQDCPNDIPEDSGVRRTQAKRWFSKGQTASSAGDDVAALKAYQCSLRYVPHGFTSFNIAQIAERIGDLELAIASYNQYLLLVPDPKDGREVTDKVTALKERLARAKEKEKEIIAAVPVGVAEPPPAEEKAGQPKPAKTPVAEPAKPVESITEEPSPTNYRMAAWIVYGGAGVVLLGGVITNLMARSKMDTCRSRYAQDPDNSRSVTCSDAKTLAYTSYVLFGLGAASAVVGTVLVLHPTESSEVSMNLMPEGGLSLAWGGKW